MELPRYHRVDPRIERIVKRSLVSNVYLPFIFAFAIELGVFGSLLRKVCPDLDINSWDTILRILCPTVIVLILATIFLLAVLYVRNFRRKKGDELTVLYLFPEALGPRMSIIILLVQK